MRITAERKKETRQRITRCAHNLFASKGFERTTTRDIAESAGIATGTMFNYFSTKEALAMALITQAQEEAAQEFESRLRGEEALDELLFAHVAIGLRHLAPHRRFAGEVLETALSPFAGQAMCEQAEQMRAGHLERVGELIATSGECENGPPDALTMHLYWTLYLGVLSFWAADASLNKEDTLVVLDQSMRLFVSSLSSESKRTREDSNGIDNTQTR